MPLFCALYLGGENIAQAGLRLAAIEQGFSLAIRHWQFEATPAHEVTVARWDEPQPAVPWRRSRAPRSDDSHRRLCGNRGLQRLHVSRSAPCRSASVSTSVNSWPAVRLAVHARVVDLPILDLRVGEGRRHEACSSMFHASEPFA